MSEDLQGTPAALVPDAGRELEGRVLPGAGLTVAERMVVDAAVPELKPRVREIVDVARRLLDEDGIDALSMRAIAARLDVRAPSLYKHLPDKQAILDVLVADILRENGDVMRAAITGAEDPVGAIISGFRRWALEHPQRYRVAMDGPLADTPLVQSAALHSGDPLRWAMRDDLEGAVTLWSFAHGLVDLEMKQRLPPAYDPGMVWARGVAHLRHADDDIELPPPMQGTASTSEFWSDPPEDVTLSPRAARIVEVARELLEEDGEEGMSMRRIASRLGVRAPSLYKHLPDKLAMENAIIAHVLREMGGIGMAAGAAAAAADEDPLVAVMTAYREYAHAHPALYRLYTRGRLDPGPLVRGAELRSAEPIARATGHDGVAAMTIWSFVHGLVDLESKGRVPDTYDREAVFLRGIAALRPVEGRTW
ncbi:TetR/AcrR family transcriptional regulator [Patulibacter sp.]|uniref:TetR/AcrR family transcriptional regulator n=1 Tax=Patulibacter sp. TaxID=1912859 RepID=UPI0027203655|nr:TetR/AcrR family transcriptional regulator [Patulibacter sp.]MDO9407093.1 TetR/AcrR family transcriptional regulator [Patulibacter sp.]